MIKQYLSVLSILDIRILDLFYASIFEFRIYRNVTTLS